MLATLQDFKRGEPPLGLDDKEVVTAMSVKMRAEIISYGPDCLVGELNSKYLEVPYKFSSLIRMIEKMEEIFDSKGFPEAFLSPRTFKDMKRK